MSGASFTALIAASLFGAAPPVDPGTPPAGPGAAIASPGTAPAAPSTPPAATDDSSAVMSVSPKDCIARALEENLELQVDRIAPQLERADWMAARGRFEPSLGMSAEWEDATSPIFPADRIPGGRRSDENEYTRYEGSLGGLLPTGLSYDIASAANNHEGVAANFQSRWSSDLGITLTQPLLRDAGPGVQMAEIRIARKGAEAADAQLQYQVSRTVADVLNAYVELIFRRDNQTARQEALDLATQLLKDNETRVNIGVMSPLDVSQARTEVATQTQNVIEADRALREAQNDLKRLMFRDVGPYLQTRMVPTELPPVPSFADPVLNVVHALEYRTDLVDKRLRLEQAGIHLRKAKNALLPYLNAFGGYRLLGLQDSIDESYETTVDAYDRDWSVGVEVTIPLGMSKERGEKKRALLEQEKAVLAVKQMEQNIIVEVDNAAQAVLANEKKVDAAREARQYAYESLMAEQEKLNAGASTTFVVAQLQRDLAFARSNELRAYADWQKSVVELAHQEGTLLMRLDIAFKAP
ncbi:MAG TPA: TolC family protein [Verrucomicrobiae bacterium]|nr:TolC family protein [Verrucomicrobiae bacterium]